MSKKIRVHVVYVDKGMFDDDGKIIRKEISEEVKIGRNKENDIIYNQPFISRKHGRIFIEEGIFKTHIDYEDFSTHGSTILRWHNGHPTTEFVHGKKVKLKPNDWIVLLDSGSYGIILKVYCR
jgi:pSer/pThr/pTyr-binding forkhead associated (FHA) protein